jgi:hypothetical protein
VGLEYAEGIMLYVTKGGNSGGESYICITKHCQIWPIPAAVLGLRMCTEGGVSVRKLRVGLSEALDIWCARSQPPLTLFFSFRGMKFLFPTSIPWRELSPEVNAKFRGIWVCMPTIINEMSPNRLALSLTRIYQNHPPKKTFIALFESL